MNKPIVKFYKESGKYDGWTSVKTLIKDSGWYNSAKRRIEGPGKLTTASGHEIKTAAELDSIMADPFYGATL